MFEPGIMFGVKVEETKEIIDFYNPIQVKHTDSRMDFNKELIESAKKEIIISLKSLEYIITKTNYGNMTLSFVPYPYEEEGYKHIKSVKIE